MVQNVEDTYRLAAAAGRSLVSPSISSPVTDKLDENICLQHIYHVAQNAALTAIPPKPGSLRPALQHPPCFPIFPPSRLEEQTLSV